METLLLHQRIKVIRLRKNYSQAYMADELNVDVTNYSRMEKGQTKITVERLKEIASILDVSICYLINNKQSPSTNDNDELLQEILKELQQIKSLITK